MKKAAIIIAFSTLLLVVPFFLWIFKESIEWNVLVIDKTVPQKDYVEHQGLFWILQHERFKPTGQAKYKIDRDYYGYHPDKKIGDTVLNSSHPDMIYITDTYGVYTDDLKGKTAGKRSELIYGGMQEDEWNQLQGMRDEETIFIAEFNTFASPTPKAVRQQMEKSLGVRWSGWTGRYFPKLEDKEVPEWLRRNYEAQTGKAYALKGPGIAFVNESDQLMILENEDFKGQVWFQLNEEGNRTFKGVKNSPYQYWFDIVEPDESSTVLASYQIDAGETGKGKLLAYGIPARFPAVIYNEGHHSYYFAGDYADIRTKALKSWEYTPLLKSFLSAWTSKQEFYWRSYVPMMSHILSK